LSGFLLYNKSVAISWSFRRKALYSGTTALVALCIVWLIWFKFFDAPPSCMDGRQDADELGVDCGGSCSLLCQSQTQDPTVLWSRAFPSGVNTYTAAAYVKNNNRAGAHNVHYAFQFFDADSKLVLEKDGVMDIPPIPVVPVVDTGIYTGSRTITRTLFSLSDTPVWVKADQSISLPLKVTLQTLTPDGSRLDATIQNNSLTQDYSNLVVAAVLFDAQGIARASSKSLVVSLQHQANQKVVFTWPAGVPDAVRSEVTILPSF
jgi:hypothetical protein